jgi:glycosyltransferase involved in cell wall biosynthesis
MHLSVVICTWNRAAWLDRTLTEMRHLRVPPGITWELLVVNNQCTDATDDIIARHADWLPLRRLFEPLQGLSHARNAAIQAAHGDLILWTDDDVLVDGDWLAAYVEAARRWPAAAYFGGLIVPLYEEKPPRWVEENLRLLDGVLVIRDLGPLEAPFGAREHPFGANMAFRRRVFEDVAFDPSLGRSGQQCILGEEVALIARLRDQGLQGVWVPAAKVRHLVGAQRMTREYLWRYNLGYGRTSVRTDGVPRGRLLGGAPRWLYGQYAVLLWRYHYERLLRRPTWVGNFIRAARTRGMIAESRLCTAATQRPALTCG